MGYADRLFDLTDHVVLITGGSRGLGREMAFAAARGGADVVIASRNMDNCVATAKEIETETDRSAMAYQVHVGRWDELDGLVETSYERFGKVDTLINNAGMSPLYDKLTNVTEKLFDAVVNLNLKGPFRLSALVGERMVAAGRGSIVNLSSTGSLRPNGGIIPYAAAKAGIQILTQDLAAQAGPSGVRVNCLAPETILTERNLRQIPAEVQEQLVGMHPIRRLGTPEDVARAARYLASDEADWITGVILDVAGGSVLA